MSFSKERGLKVRDFILKNVEDHSKGVVGVTATHFKISRQAVLKHIKKLSSQGVLQVLGSTKDRVYSLKPVLSLDKEYAISSSLEEDVVWRDDIMPEVNKLLSDKAANTWHYCFTEILNNAKDHSGGSKVTVHIVANILNMELLIVDDGEGIFKKIQRELSLLDERQAILELSKGKLTTDPDRHSGEGIFFSSRMVDVFTIMSGDSFFAHDDHDTNDWIMDQPGVHDGTCVFMKLANNSSRMMKEVFDKYASEEGDYGFTKTIIPVKLAQYGDELLVSRSQAKRLLARIDKFKTVVFDFEGVTTIGQAFSDEMFRVYPNLNPDVEILYVSTNKPVESMIKRAMSH